MNELMKRAISFVLTATAALSISLVAYASWQPDWAYYTDYDDAYMVKSCSFSIGTADFEGVMGIFATSPYATVKMETGSSDVSSNSVKYSTKANCVYVDSSGNEQSYNASGTSKIMFKARGANQMFSSIVGTHKATYNGTSRGSTTLY